MRSLPIFTLEPVIHAPKAPGEGFLLTFRCPSCEPEAKCRIDVLVPNGEAKRARLWDGDTRKVSLTEKVDRREVTGGRCGFVGWVREGEVAW